MYIFSMRFRNTGPVLTDNTPYLSVLQCSYISFFTGSNAFVIDIGIAHNHTGYNLVSFRQLQHRFYSRIKLCDCTEKSAVQHTETETVCLKLHICTCECCVYGIVSRHNGNKWRTFEKEVVINFCIFERVREL